MRVINKTRRIVVDENAREAASFFSRMRGLMFAKRPQTIVLVSPGESVAETGIHMWFMRQPIDVIWLDSRLKTVDVREAAKPWAFRIFKPKRAAKYVVECPIGTIKRTGTRDGDAFSFSKD